MVYAEFGGQTECIMGNWKIENNNKGLCNNYQEGGGLKPELSSKNLDSTPPPKQKNQF